MLSSAQREQQVCQTALNTLLDMRLRGEIAPNKYSDKEAEWLKKQREAEKQVKLADYRTRNWLKTAEETLDFSLTAKERFRTGSVEDKAHILRFLGSKLVLKDFEFKDKREITHQKVNEIELAKSLTVTSQTEVGNPVISDWWAIQDSDL